MLFLSDYLELNVSLKGAEIKSLKFKDFEILNDNPNDWNYSSPYLFPSVGRSKDNETIINGKNYTMPMHGFLRDLDFTFDGENFILNSNDYPELKKYYPFDFEVSINYELIKTKVKVTISILNTSLEDMPFNFGLHPAFKVNNLDDYEINFEEKENASSPTICGGLLDFSNPTYEFKDLKSIKLNYDLFKVDTLIFKNLKSRSVYLNNSLNYPKIIFNFPSFNNLALWTNERKKTKFICIEPWIGHGDYLNTDKIFLNRPDIIILKPQEKTNLYYTIELEE